MNGAIVHSDKYKIGRKKEAKRSAGESSHGGSSVLNRIIWRHHHLLSPPSKTTSPEKAYPHNSNRKGHKTCEHFSK